MQVTKQQIVDADTPDKWWELRDLFLKNTSPNINENFLLIRSLSINEYDKYLINSSLSGAIVTGDDKVWRYTSNNTTKGMSYYWSSQGRNRYNNLTVGSKLDNGYVVKYSNSTKIYAQGRTAYKFGSSYAIIDYSDNTWSENLNFFASIVQNSTENQSVMISSEKYDFELIANYSAYDYSELRGQYFSTTNRHTSTVNKTSTAPTIFFNGNMYVRFSNNYYGANFYIQFNLCHVPCFSPVFQYIDNNKSENVYY